MHRTLNQDFFKKWTPEMAYVLGYFAADGSMIKNKRNGHFIEFTSTDLVLIQNLQLAVHSNHKITTREHGGNCKIAYRLQLGSKQWFADLEKLGFTPNKSMTLKFPEVPIPCIGDFIRGYFDGDGCVYFGKLKFSDRKKTRFIFLTMFTSGSYQFLESLWTVLKKSTIVGGSLYKKGRGFNLSFSHLDSLALYRLIYHTAKASDLFLPRKRRKLERAIKVLGLNFMVRP